MKNTHEPKFDLRTLERYLREGTITRQEYEKFLAQIPDMNGNLEEIPLANEDENDSLGKIAKGLTFLS